MENDSSAEEKLPRFWVGSQNVGHGLWWVHSGVFRSMFKEYFLSVIAGAQGDNMLPQGLSPEAASFLKSDSDFEGWCRL